MKKVLVDPKKLVTVTENHGGYEEAKCVVCDASGWLGQIKHKRGCVATGVGAEEVKGKKK